MLKSFEIENYRMFEHLNIEPLGQVNLISGKNNVGKTALLEALRIWASRGESSVVNNIINGRGQFRITLTESYISLFTRKNDRQNFPTLIIQDLRISPEKKEDRFIVSFESSGFPSHDLLPSISPDFPKDSAIFVPFGCQTFPVQQLWDKIVLTPLEDEVIKILKCVEPDVIRIDVKEGNSKIRLARLNVPIPLKNLGDGVQRMLEIAIALVSAKEAKVRLLLIDEFEAGLHHSVQESLWDLIFEYSKKWDIQVFATTHSLDTVRAFAAVTAKYADKVDGRFFRLEKNYEGQIEAVLYEPAELDTALEYHLETR